ncbi:MAG: PAS domain S-box protein, partial [Myxococcales bacterium]
MSSLRAPLSASATRSASPSLSSTSSTRMECRPSWLLALTSRQPATLPARSHRVDARHPLIRSRSTRDDHAGEPLADDRVVIAFERHPGEVPSFMSIPQSSGHWPPHDPSLLAAIVTSSGDAIFSEDAGGLISSWNQGAAHLLGYSASEVLGRPASRLVPAEERESTNVLIGSILEGGSRRSFESRRLHKDGRVVAMSLSLSRIDGESSSLGVAWIARDITERQRADEKVRAASEYARNLIESSLDPLVTISPEGKITDVNEATIRATGVARERLIGTDFSDYFVEPEKAREGYQQVFSQGSVIDYPLTIRHRDGRLTDVLYNASVYRDLSGQVLGVFAAARDVTSQTEASQYARSLVEASLDPLVTISPEGKITDVNKATIEVTGVARERLIGTDF